MSTFISPKARVRVEFEDPKGGKNYVMIKGKMDLGTAAAVQRELMEVSIRADVRSREDMESLGFRFSKLHQDRILLKNNIVSWSGDVFTDDKGRPVEYRQRMVDQLDPKENKYWIDLVLAEIDALNKSPVKDPDPITRDNESPKSESGETI